MAWLRCRRHDPEAAVATTPRCTRRGIRPRRRPSSSPRDTKCVQGPHRQADTRPDQITARTLLDSHLCPVTLPIHDVVITDIGTPRRRLRHRLPQCTPSSSQGRQTRGQPRRREAPQPIAGKASVQEPQPQPQPQRRRQQGRPPARPQGRRVARAPLQESQPLAKPLASGGHAQEGRQRYEDMRNTKVENLQVEKLQMSASTDAVGVRCYR